jgi:tetratricopeptide (TPR) repeat protein
MRTRADRTAVLALVATLVVAVGCASGARRPATTAPSKAAADGATAERPVATDPVSPAAPVGIASAVEHDIAGFTLTRSEPVADDVRTDYAAAIRLLDAGRFAAAIAVLEALGERAPDVAAVQHALGVAHARIDALEEAEAALRLALALDPGHPVTLNELGLVQRRLGRFEASRASYEEALSRFDGFHPAHRNLAILCDLYLADTACALTHYEAYAQIVPDDPDVAKWIADLQMRAGLEGTR